MDITKDKVVKFLRKVNILTAALVGERGPISTPLLFAVEDDLSKIYVATHKDSFKSRALLVNPQISASVWQFGEMLIQLDGIAREVIDPLQVPILLDKLVESLGRIEDFWPPVLRMEGESYIIFEITPTWVRALDLSSQTIVSGDNPFTEITI